MPPKPIIELSQLDTSKVAIPKEKIYQVNPHRFEFQQLDGIYVIDYEKNVMAGYRNVRDDEFWVRGHIPGRPLFPGVLMIETAAQLVSYYAMSHSEKGGFIGFAGVDDVKFRGAVTPGNRIIMLGRMVEQRPRRYTGDTQAFVDGKMVYEGRITGMWV